MSKLIGLITAWGAEPFIEPAIKQGLEYCDELLVCVSANHDEYYKYEDNTMEICQKYGNQIKLIEGVRMHHHPDSKKHTLKKMLDETGNNKKGNWIWILDADEFYFPEDIDVCKQVIKEDKFNRIMMPEKTFLVNTKHYVVWGRDRLKKLINDNMFFTGTNDLGYENQFAPYQLETEKGMFHYTFLLNPYFKAAFWYHHYGSPPRDVRDNITWLNEIYLTMDLNNQQESVLKSMRYFGNQHKSVLGKVFTGGPWQPVKENGELYEYKGLHPSFIEEAKLTEINDFRKLYQP